MNSFLEGLPTSVRLVVILLTGSLAVLGGVKSGVIDFSGGSTPIAIAPPPIPTTTPPASPSIEMINIRLNLRDGEIKESIPNAKVEVIYLSGSIIDYTDSTGFLDIKIPKTDTTKIFVIKQGYQALDRQLDPSLNIPQDRNMTFYLYPVKGESSIEKLIPEPPQPEPKKTDSTSSASSEPSTSSELSSDKGIKIVSPEEFMRLFYDKINSRDLESAWLMLSERRRSKQEKGFESFREWWGEKVQRVNVKDIRIIRETSDAAEIEVLTSYVINQKEVNEEPITFRLAMNLEKGSWEILSKDE